MIRYLYMCGDELWMDALPKVTCKCGKDLTPTGHIEFPPGVED